MPLSEQPCLIKAVKKSGTAEASPFVSFTGDDKAFLLPLLSSGGEPVGRVTVNEERCKGCGYCIEACNKESLHIDNSRRNRNGYSVASFNADGDCSGCAMCAEVCPDAALEVYR
jgi:2-oxoglutarate ferredoxin oxidoreductase subunit delta